MICPECGSADVRHEVREEQYTYKGQTTSFLVEGEYCQDCGEAVLSREESQRLNKEMLAFNASVNASQFNPERIQSVRKKLGLDQKEAAAMFGGGVNAFSRYERGKIAPPKSLEVLFEMIEKRPELGEFAKECAANVSQRASRSPISIHSSSISVAMLGWARYIAAIPSSNGTAPLHFLPWSSSLPSVNICGTLLGEFPQFRPFLRK